MVLVIDNYDSFTYNLVQYLLEMTEVRVVRNDQITLEEIEELAPEGIVISPGPGRPEATGISRELITRFQGVIPILGVCLGHQCIGQVYGGRIVRARELYHGKTSQIYFDKDRDPGLFAGLSNPFTATRYHSLIVDPESVPARLEVVARTEEGEIMALVHREYPVYGFQFHPESVLTEQGRRLLNNFLKLKGDQYRYVQ